IDLAAINIEKKHVLTLQAPGGTNAKIGKLAVLVCGVPALKDLIKSFRLLVRGVWFQPFRFDDDSRGWLRILLIVSGKIVLSHGTTLRLQPGQRYECRLQCVPISSVYSLMTIRCY